MKFDNTLLRCTRRGWLRASALGIGLLAAPRQVALAQDAVEAIEQPEQASRYQFALRAFELRDRASAAGDPPCGAVIVNDSGQIVGQAPSRVVTARDPTAHAQMEAIRDAARRLGTPDLSGHVMYATSGSCPMCEAAAYWADLPLLIYGLGCNSGRRPRLPKCRRYSRYSRHS